MLGRTTRHSLRRPDLLEIVKRSQEFLLGMQLGTTGHSIDSKTFKGGPLTCVEAIARTSMETAAAIGTNCDDALVSSRRMKPSVANL